MVCSIDEQKDIIGMEVGSAVSPGTSDIYWMRLDDIYQHPNVFKIWNLKGWKKEISVPHIPTDMLVKSDLIKLVIYKMQLYNSLPIASSTYHKKINQMPVKYTIHGLYGL